VAGTARAVDAAARAVAANPAKISSRTTATTSLFPKWSGSLRLPSPVMENNSAAENDSDVNKDSTAPIASFARKNLLSVPQPDPPAQPTPLRRPGTKLLLAKHSRSGSKASAKPKEAVLAYIASQRHHAETAQYKVEQSSMRPPNIVLFALWAFNSHGWQSPEHLGARYKQMFVAPFTAPYCAAMPFVGSAAHIPKTY